MMGRLARRHLRRAALLGAFMQALLLTAAPVEHHDLICHLKTPQHCVSCVSSPLGSFTYHTPAGHFRLPLAGWAITLVDRSTGRLLLAQTTGRSPPPAA